VAGTQLDWTDELGRRLAPFLARLRHEARRRMCPLCIAGPIGPGHRKSVQSMTERLAPGDHDQLHHFDSAGLWDASLLEDELLVQTDRLVAGQDAVLVIDDTALPKKGKHSVGVAPQYASALGKNANCQTLVSLTLARWGGACDGGPASVSARELDERSSAAGARRGSGRVSSATPQARDRPGGDQWHRLRSRGSIWLARSMPKPSGGYGQLTDARITGSACH
jgi:hypothetical protein